ncbi:MAG: riboflavin synthase [Candidatus Dormibacteria bacterium]
MFSGIVVEVGQVEAISELAITVRAAHSLGRTRVGGSVAVNGVCLTASSITGGVFTADVMPETFRRTALGALAPGARVNLEPALTFGEEVGGHLVQGHVDATGTVVAIRNDGNSLVVEVEAPGSILAFCVEKGSIAIDGASLTIATVDLDRFTVSLIPHTLANTVAGDYAVGTRVNLEVDVLAKYVARYLASHSNPAAAGS